MLCWCGDGNRNDRLEFGGDEWNRRCGKKMWRLTVTAPAGSRDLLPHCTAGGAREATERSCPAAQRWSSRPEAASLPSSCRSGALLVRPRRPSWALRHRGALPLRRQSRWWRRLVVAIGVACRAVVRAPSVMARRVHPSCASGSPLR